jgi:hypothetical protein
MKQAEKKLGLQDGPADLFTIPPFTLPRGFRSGLMNKVWLSYKCDPPNTRPRHTSCFSLRSARSAPQSGAGDLGR